jgi:hypothetical protein
MERALLRFDDIELGGRAAVDGADGPTWERSTASPSMAGPASRTRKPTSEFPSATSGAMMPPSL